MPINHKKNQQNRDDFLPNRTMIIHCYSHHVVVGISSGRNSMKANSRIIREINKPMLKAETKNGERKRYAARTE